ncbi:hypothetical protein SAMN05216489_02554 [Streptomyces sp. 3213]|uniref:hypothetical protein n=1 Tax=Streptomyces sp. 3213.3 TaxID=1855348 RepID=UPI00089B86EF|nr:hypothetical protein [Streptomyces sp. 3213.3]SED11475.1 hypothetical protein SAMN05216489_02554 [Streptomyces sp. 3213] [Streptomyces sp. 3213.3]
MVDLMETPDDAQQALIEIIWAIFRDQGRFPLYSYVQSRMKASGFDPAEALTSLPTVTFQPVLGRYRAVDFDAGGGTAQPESPVYLTMAGLYHVLKWDGNAVMPIISVLLDWATAMGRARERYAESPFEVPDVSVSWDEAQTSTEASPDLALRVLAIAEHEWPGLRVRLEGGVNMGRLGLIEDGPYDTIEAYLSSVTALMPPPRPTSILDSHDPNALPRSLTNFDITCELVLKRVLINKPAISRTAWFSQDATSQSDLQAGVSALGEVIGDLDVPGRTPSHPLGRLAAYLKTELPTIDGARVNDAIELLDAVREIRNSGVHRKPSQALIAAHHRFGLSFPIQDPTTAWRIVRAQMDAAFTMLQEEIYAARV